MAMNMVQYLMQQFQKLNEYGKLEWLTPEERQRLEERKQALRGMILQKTGKTFGWGRQAQVVSGLPPRIQEYEQQYEYARPPSSEYKPGHIPGLSGMI